MRKSKSSLFLMELIIVIFFFALTAAVCLQIFVRADLVAKQTEDMNYAILWAENAAECFFEFGADEKKVTETLADAFDNDGYRYELGFRDDDEFHYLDFSFFTSENEQPVYSYSFKQNRKEVSK